MKRDMDIDLIMSSCKGKKTFVITLLRDKESLQRYQRPYLAQRPELGPDLPLLDVVEDKVRVALSRHPHQGDSPHIEGSAPERTRTHASPYDRGLDDRLVTEQVPADYPPWRHRGTDLLCVSCPRARRNFGGARDGELQVGDHGRRYARRSDTRLCLILGGDDGGLRR
jgi:hypothetical protein